MAKNRYRPFKVFPEPTTAGAIRDRIEQLRKSMNGLLDGAKQAEINRLTKKLDGLGKRDKT